MCGRFTLSKSPTAIEKEFSVEISPQIEPQYNIYPTQMVGTILHNIEKNERQFRKLRWGLIPSWAKDINIGSKMINARAESVAEKPSFRAAFKRRRCLIIVDGFYEWQMQGNKKQPYYIRMEDGRPFAFAGLWEHWESPGGEKIYSCTIVTTEPNELMKSIHERMPVIIAPEDYHIWLDTQGQDSESIKQLLRPYSAKEMIAYPVGSLVNNPRYNHADCLMPV
jgi:putative SOS response-associated peptidase YedK